MKVEGDVVVNTKKAEQARQQLIKERKRLAERIQTLKMHDDTIYRKEIMRVYMSMSGFKIAVSFLLNSTTTRALKVTVMGISWTIQPF